MRILLTAGPTWEAIDAVRYIGNRSSGQMGAAIAATAIDEGHEVTLICGPVSAAMPVDARRIDVESAREMHDAVLREFPSHELLIMAAAVADFRPAHPLPAKLPRHDSITLELIATDDILADVATIRQPNQRTVGFSLEMSGDLHRAHDKLTRKKLDLIIYNPMQTMNAIDVDPVLIYPDGREERPGILSKVDFSQLLLARAEELF